MSFAREVRDKYDRDGYFIFDLEVSETVLDGIIDDMRGKYGNSEIEAYSQPGRIQDAWRISSNVKSVALAPKALALLEHLYGCKPLPFQTLNFPVGTEQHPHSDTIHFNSMPSGYMCGIWVALEDIDLDNGPLVYYPGSHRLPELTIEHVNKAIPPAADFYTTEELYSRYERLIDSRIERFELKPKYGGIKKGEALLWSANLLHGGAPQTNKSRTRHSQVTHYFFEGCRYYTPLHSRGSEVLWRYPAWILDGSPQPDSGPVPSVAPAYEGFLDVANPKQLSGWAWDRNRPGAVISVDIYDGDRLSGTTRASEYRPDVQDYTKDNGCHAFAYRTPPSQTSGRPQVITVKISGTDIVLTNSPQSIAR